MTTKVDNIIKAYANNLEGLTREECLDDDDFYENQCKVLEKVLGKGAEGVITPAEQDNLKERFSTDFIQDLAGIDGKKALRLRVRWLVDHINTKWYRPDYNSGEREAMIRELTEIGRDATEVIPALTLALKDEKSNVRCMAADALGAIGPDAKESVPALTLALKDESVLVFRNAAMALGKIGPDAKDAVPALINALEDDEWFPAAVDALGSIGKEAVPALIDALKNKDKNVRIRAINVLYHIGKQAFFAIPVLQEMAVNDPDTGCRKIARWVLDQMMEEIR